MVFKGYLDKLQVVYDVFSQRTETLPGERKYIPIHVWLDLIDEAMLYTPDFHMRQVPHPAALRSCCTCFASR